MQLKILLKRLQSNLIDLTLFLSIYLFLLFVSGIIKTQSNLIYITFVAFLLYFVVPILSIGNTFGKAIVGISWNNIYHVKHILLFKYIFYFSFFAPNFSLVSTFTNFPFINNFGYDKILSLQLAVSLIFIDLMMFIGSFGRYHALDYILNLKINGMNYNRLPLVSLTFILFFLGSFIALNFTCHRYNIDFQNLNKALAREIYWEHYSEDLYHGNKPMIIKKKSDEVFAPSEILSFLFDKEYSQKVIYLVLPEKILNSANDRKIICYNLIDESMTNDIFNSYKPVQTKIVLTTIKEGNFFEYYNYNYTYFFDRNLPELGVYGGIAGDSLTARQYLDFVKKIVDKKDFAVTNKKIDKAKYYNLKASFSKDYYNVLLLNEKLSFKFIKFEDVKKKGDLQLNFPPQSVIYRSNYFNFSEENLQIDDNVYYLKFARDNISNNNL
ncbi:hypothetical protein DSC47_10270 [Elizabethkingia miricola]|uniref:hypothetical protein n=1 Tax=Elizabethkingia bruuniana TaxID=1756149 RepID=UPI0009997ABA|nr:hypothetical protein [Elizabethkingia bruuniana]OPC66327.1 hypothetical protein BAY13_16440 [Elizabethkingia bruuniana]RBI91674.1 hypothetical protein DSC47_10270 [Elizabethkingia miricola]